MSLSIDDSEIAFSSRRSVSRSRVVVILDDHGGVMMFNELADACGMTTTRLRDVILGNGQDFSVGRSPFTLGQIVLQVTPEGEMCILTEEGKAEAARLRREPHWARGRGRR